MVFKYGLRIEIDAVKCACRIKRNFLSLFYKPRTLASMCAHIHVTESMSNKLNEKKKSKNQISPAALYRTACNPSIHWTKTIKCIKHLEQLSLFQTQESLLLISLRLLYQFQMNLFPFDRKL